VRSSASALRSCTLCPSSAVDRLSGAPGYCPGARGAPGIECFCHYGEERPLVGAGGSGTIFLDPLQPEVASSVRTTRSHGGDAHHTHPGDCGSHGGTAETGCHNIQLRHPYPLRAKILESLSICCRCGLSVPLCTTAAVTSRSKSSGHSMGFSISTCRHQVLSSAPAQHYCNALTIPDVVKEVVKEDAAQVGRISSQMRAHRPRAPHHRHLVMPGLRGEHAGGAVLYSD